MFLLLDLMIRVIPFFRMSAHRSVQGLNTVCHKSSWPTGFEIFDLHVLGGKPSLLYLHRATAKDIEHYVALGCVVPGVLFCDVNDEFVVLSDMFQRDGINQDQCLLECQDRTYNVRLVFTEVVGRQPVLVEGNLRYLL